MASILMHICVSNMLKEKYNLSNKFLVGAALPDLLKKVPPYTRESVHYIKVIRTNGEEKGIPDVEEFINENNTKLEQKDEYALGYLAHLIQDKIWFDIFVPKYIKNIGYDLNKVLYINENEFHIIDECNEQMYLDYINIDKHLLNKYNLNLYEVKENLLNNIPSEKIKKVVEIEIKEMSYPKNRFNKFFTNEDVEKFVKLSIENCDKYIYKFLQNK